MTVPTPELDKMKAVKAESQAIGEFIEWQESKGRCLCENVAYEWTPVNRSIESLLADYFNIDLAKCEEEKRAILAELRKEQT